MRVIILLVVTTLLASLLSAADATFVFLTSALVKANGVGRAGNGNNRAVGVMDGTRKGGKGEGAVAAMDRKNSTKKKKKKKMMMKKKKTAKAKAPITPQAKNPIEALLKKTEVQQQLGSMVLSMVASRAIMKLDFKNQRVLQQSRVIFIVYLVASQLLFTYMRSAIEREDNGREITLGGAASFAGIPIPMLGKAGAVAGLADGSGDDTGGGAGGKTITVKEHDLAEVAKLSSSVMMEMVSTSYMHFSKGAGKPLLFVPLMGIVNKLRAPVVQVHVFNRRARGRLSRPFKGGMENVMKDLLPGGMAGMAGARAAGAGAGAGPADTGTGAAEVGNMKKRKGSGKGKGKGKDMGKGLGSSKKKDGGIESKTAATAVEARGGADGTGETTRAEDVGHEDDE